jgi:hypothetical protein
MSHAGHGAPAGADAGPVLAPKNASPALASRPDLVLEDAYDTYEATPAPWWIALLWASFFIFAVTYLITNLLE